MKRTHLPVGLAAAVLAVSGCRQVEENQAPTAEATGPETVSAGTWVQLDGSGSSDPEDDPLNRRWAFVRLPLASTATLNDTSVVNPSFYADVPGEYEVRLVVDDGFQRSAPAAVTVTATPVNGAPVAEAGLDRNVVTGNDVLLDGAASFDPDGDTLTFSWTFVQKPSGSIAAFDDATASAPTFRADLDGDYRVRLVVSDGTDDSEPDFVVVNASADNLAPIAEAGVDQSVPVDTEVTLDGSASYDPNGAALTWAWTFTDRPTGSTAALTQDGTAAATFTPDVEGTFAVALVVDDGLVTSAPDVVRIQAYIENEPPVADAGADITNAVRGKAVQLDGSQSFDPDPGDVLTYLWQFTGRPLGSQAALNDPNVVRPTFTPDVSTDAGEPTDGYELRLQVWDGVFWSPPATVRVDASEGNVPPVADAGADITTGVEVGDVVQLDGSASHDGEGGEPLAWHWRFVETPSGFFGGLNDDAIVNPSFVPTVPTTTTEHYVLELDVWDGEFWSPVPGEVTVTVGAGNQPPTAHITGVTDGECDVDTTLGTPLTTCDVANTGGVVVTLTGEDSVDEAPDDLLYEWAFSSKPSGSSASFNDGALQAPSFVPDVNGSYVVRLRVWDGAFWSDPVAVTLSVDVDANRRPTANAGTDFTTTEDITTCPSEYHVPVGETFQLDGTGSSDPETAVELLDFRWAFQSLPQGSAARMNDATVDEPTFTPDVNGRYELKLLVSDGELWSAPDTVLIDARCGNTAPDADAGIDQDVAVDTFVQLDGGGSEDPEAPGNPDVLFYEWEFTALPQGSDAELNDPGVKNPSFYADEVGTYGLRLRVSDGELQSGWSYVTVDAT